MNSKNTSPFNALEKINAAATLEYVPSFFFFYLFLLENSLWLMHTLNAQQKSAAARPWIFGQQMGQSWSYLHAWFPFSQLS